MKNNDIMLKGEIRQSMQDKRWAMAEVLRGKAAQAIMKRILGMPSVAEAVRIFCYVSRPPEVDTWELIAALLDRGKEVYCPRMLSGDTMEAVRIDDIQDLKRSKFGIFEPLTNQDTAAAEEMDVALVPGLAFDRKGTRLGYGKGYYDRFLRDGDIIKIGIGYAIQIVDTLPEAPHDMGMDMVVTESEIITV